MTEVAAALPRANLALAAAILLVLALRLPTRRAFGCEIAYRLWAAPPLALFASLLPPRVAALGPHRAADLAAFHPSESAVRLLVLAWLVGIGVWAALQGRAQLAFLRAARDGRAGPAVLGLVRPRIVMPADDGRYAADERAVIRAHERAHIARRDPAAAALIAALQGVAWFNPLVHLAAHLARLDQELACDAAVLRRGPGQRALYARTLLKTQLAVMPLPFGCYWPAVGRHPLEVRVGLLKRSPASNPAGPALALGCVLAAGALAWLAQPPAAPRAPYVWPRPPIVIWADISPPLKRN
jgi:beta-lactamase regulating signal transducer with metallopeptidase domain